MLDAHEDDTLHLHKFVQHQRSLTSFLSRVNRFAKCLTVVVLLYGIAVIVRIFLAGWRAFM